MAAGVGVGFTLYNYLGEPFYMQDADAFYEWLDIHGLPWIDIDSFDWKESDSTPGQKSAYFYTIYNENTNETKYFDKRYKMEEYIDDCIQNGDILQTRKDATHYVIVDSSDQILKTYDSVNAYLQAQKDGSLPSGTLHALNDANKPAPLSLDVDDYEDLGEFFTSTEPYYDEAGNLIATPSPETGNNESADGTPSADKDTDSLTPGEETPDSVDPSTGNGSSDQKGDSGSHPESGNGSTENSGSGNDSSTPTEGTSDSGNSDTPVEDNNTDNTDSGSTDDSSGGEDPSTGGESGPESDNGGGVSSTPESTDSSADASPEPQTPVE